MRRCWQGVRGRRRRRAAASVCPPARTRCSPTPRPDPDPPTPPHVRSIPWRKVPPGVAYAAAGALALGVVVWMLSSGGDGGMLRRQPTAWRGGTRIAFVTAVIGPYEKTLKEPVQQTVPADFIAFLYPTDVVPLKSTSAWKVLPAEPYFNGIDASDRRVDVRTSMSKNQHPFNKAKFFKLNLHRLPELKKYDVVVWLDATVQIKRADVAERVLNLADAGAHLIVHHHPG